MPEESFSDYYQLSISDLTDRLQTTTEGLSGGIALERLQQGGPNLLREEQKRSPLQMLFEQYSNPMIILLLVAALVSGAIGELKDTLVILIIVILNSLIGFVQEFRAEKAMTALQ